MVLSAIEAGLPGAQRRSMGRRKYRTTARLRLFADGPEAMPRILYTRDASRRGLGFVTTHRLPLGYGGIVELLDPTGQLMKAYCTLLRCREAAPGWFEGNVYFNRDQSQFDAD